MKTYILDNKNLKISCESDDLEIIAKNIEEYQHHVHIISELVDIHNSDIHDDLKYKIITNEKR